MSIGVEMPLAGDDGAAGLSALDGIRFAVAAARLPRGLDVRLVVRDTARGGFRNPHRDEGTDDSALPASAASIAVAFRRDGGIAAVVGGLRAHIGAADAAAAGSLPLETLAPAPDASCAATRARPRGALPSAPVPRAGGADAHSPAGSEALEPLAAARSGAGGGTAFILAPREPDRAALVRCLRSTLVAAGVRVAIGTPGTNVDASRATVFAVGPRERGTLVCTLAAFRAGGGATLAASEHRDYDSATLPPGCTWVRRAGLVAGAPASFVRSFRARYGHAPDDDAAAGYLATRVVLGAVEAAFARGAPNGDAASRVATVRAAVADAAARGITVAWQPQPSAGCAKGSAPAARFERRTATATAAFVVRDARCGP